MPPPPPLEEEPGPPVFQSEAEELAWKINETTDESLSSTRRMVKLCDEAKEAGIKTLIAIDDQGEKLEKMEKGMLDIREDMEEAEKAMAGMERCCCGLFPDPFVKHESEFKDDPNLWKKSEGAKGGGDLIPRECDMTGVPTYGGFISKVNPDDARENEMEKNMEEVSNMVGNLRNMAIDMNSELGNQNVQIDRINMMVEANDTRVSIANERANKLNK